MRIEALERALDEKQQALEAARAELGIESGSHAPMPPDLAWHRGEIKLLKARLASDDAERARRARGLQRWRAIAVTFVAIALVAIVFGLTLAADLRGRTDALVHALCSEVRRVCQ